MELKEIVGYLPYNVKAEYTDDAGEKHIVEIDEMSTDESLGFYPSVNGVMGSCFADYKLILRPLADTMEEITISGKTFIPVSEIRKVITENGDWCDIYDEAMEHIFGEYEWNHIISIPYEMIQLLYQWHFDIHGLIVKNEAIKG